MYSVYTLQILTMRIFAVGTKICGGAWPTFGGPVPPGPNVEPPLVFWRAEFEFARKRVRLSKQAYKPKHELLSRSWVVLCHFTLDSYMI